MMTGVDDPRVLQVQYECLRVECVPFLICTLLGTSLETIHSANIPTHVNE